MARQVNILDPLGIAKTVRGQVNTLAAQAKLPPLPELPSVNVNVEGMPLVNAFNQTPDRPGYALSDRAG